MPKRYFLAFIFQNTLDYSDFCSFIYENLLTFFETLEEFSWFKSWKLQPFSIILNLWTSWFTVYCTASKHWMSRTELREALRIRRELKFKEKHTRGLAREKSRSKVGTMGWNDFWGIHFKLNKGNSIKGQLISKANVKVFIWTKNRTKYFCISALKRS